MFQKDIGIDLGTANTLVYMKGRGIIMREPSVVAVDTKTDELRVRSVGHEAKAVIGRAPGSIVAVRPLKDGVIADFDVTAAMLQSFIRQACGRGLFSRPRVVICVPSGVTEVERRAVRQAAMRAGARQVMVIEEPMAAAIGSSMTMTCRAPARMAACRTARRSTSVTPEGTQMTTRGRLNSPRPQAWRIKLCSMAAVTSKSAMTPSFSGRTATMEPGARPMTALASWPTLRTRSSSVLVSTATTLGSRMMMPRPFMYTSVLAVPRSMPMSFWNIVRNLLVKKSMIRLKMFILRSLRRVLPAGPRQNVRPKAASSCAVRWTGRPMML